jgi:two-component system cell cycle response regulator DivK
MRILVVEDEPDGQEVVTTMLEFLNIPIDIAGDVDEAEAWLFDSGHEYTAVIIDLALPNRDGWELLQLIQSNPNTAHLPCIAITAYHNSKMREETISAGFVAYFPKPLDATSFGRELARLLQ